MIVTDYPTLIEKHLPFVYIVELQNNIKCQLT